MKLAITVNLSYSTHEIVVNSDSIDKTVEQLKELFAELQSLVIVIRV